MRNSALQGKFDFYFQEFFASIDKYNFNFIIYNFMKF